jgi:hypothetical protein
MIKTPALHSKGEHLMNASAYSSILTAANPVAMHGAKASIDAVSEEASFNDRSRQRSSAAAEVPDEDGFGTFVDGDGI